MLTRFLACCGGRIRQQASARHLNGQPRRVCSEQHVSHGIAIAEMRERRGEGGIPAGDGVGLSRHCCGGCSVGGSTDERDAAAGDGCVAAPANRLISEPGSHKPQALKEGSQSREPAH